MVLSSHSTPASRLGNNRQVNITVRRSDDPFGVIQFIEPQLTFSINESKGMDIHSGMSFLNLDVYLDKYIVFMKMSIYLTIFFCSILPCGEGEGPIWECVSHLDS